jgi:hypothetical protein
MLIASVTTQEAGLLVSSDDTEGPPMGQSLTHIIGANSVFAQTILDLAQRKPELLFGAGAEPYVVS